MTISIEKSLENNNLQYKILIGNENSNLGEVDLSYNGLSTQEVEENYSIQLNSNNGSSSSSASNISYNLNNKVSFMDNCNIVIMQLFLVNMMKNR